MNVSVPNRNHSKLQSLLACANCCLSLTSWFVIIPVGNLRSRQFLLDFQHSCYREVVLTVSKLEFQCGKWYNQRTQIPYKFPSAVRVVVTPFQGGLNVQVTRYLCGTAAVQLLSFRTDRN